MEYVSIGLFFCLRLKNYLLPCIFLPSWQLMHTILYKQLPRQGQVAPLSVVAREPPGLNSVWPQLNTLTGEHHASSKTMYV